MKNKFLERKPVEGLPVNPLSASTCRTKVKVIVEGVSIKRIRRGDDAHRRAVVHDEPLEGIARGFVR